MRRKWRTPCWLAALVLCTSGCAGICYELGIPIAMPASNGMGSMWQGPPPQIVSTPAPETRSQPATSEQISVMSQRIAAADDDRKALAARLQLVEQELFEKEKAFAKGSLEIHEATQQVQNARKEIQRWKQESETLRAKLHNMEKENRETLEAVIRSMEQVVDRDANKGPVLPEIPKIPKVQ